MTWKYQDMTLPRFRVRGPTSQIELGMLLQKTVVVVVVEILCPTKNIVYTSDAGPESSLLYVLLLFLDYLCQPQFTFLSTIKSSRLKRSQRCVFRGLAPYPIIVSRNLGSNLL